MMFFMTCLLINLDSLQDGGEEKLSFTLPSSLIGVDEPALRFTKPIQGEAVAYVAGHDLVLQLKYRTEAALPCTICNEWTSHPIELEDFITSIPLTDILGPSFDYAPLLREEILVQ